MASKMILALLFFVLLITACGEKSREPSAAGQLLAEVTAPPWTLAPEPLLQIGEAEGDDAPFQLDRVRSVVRLSTGNIAVLDGGSSELRIFDSKGQFVGKTGRRGGGPGEFQRPTAMYVRGDTIIVIDPAAQRLSLHDVDARFITTRPYDKDVEAADAWLHDQSVVIGAATGAIHDRVRSAVALLPRPDSTRYFREIRVSGNSHLWVLVNGDSIKSEWLIFDYAANPVGRIYIPTQLVIHDLKEDRVLGVWRDSFDVQSVRAYSFDRPSGSVSSEAQIRPVTPLRHPAVAYDALRNALRAVQVYQEHYYSRPDGGYSFAGSLRELETFAPPAQVRAVNLQEPPGVVVRVMSGGRFGWFAVAADTTTGAMCATGEGFNMPQTWSSRAMLCF